MKNPNNEITLQELFNLKESELDQHFLQSGHSITITPPSYYEIDWNKIKTQDDVIIILKFLLSKFFIDNKIMIPMLKQHEYKCLMPYIRLIS